MIIFYWNLVGVFKSINIKEGIYVCDKSDKTDYNRSRYDLLL